MLPFLKNKQIRQSGIMSAVRKPEGGMTDAEPEQDQGNPDLEEAARSMIAAMDSKDPFQLAQALQSAYDACSTPTAAPEPEMPEAG